MEASGERSERKQNKRDMKASAKSASLPPGVVLMTHPGEGFFSKIRRCLRLRSKGKYDLGHHPPDTGLPSSRNRSCHSPVMGVRDTGLSPNSSPSKVNRRSKSDKEEVMLIRKDKRTSSGITAGTNHDNGIDNDILVVTIGGERLDAKKNGNVASCAYMDSETKDSDDVFEDLDPDYETLDDIRRKVCSQVENGGRPSDPNCAAGDVSATVTKQPLHVKSITGDLNGQDSGLGSPFTDSPGSSRESQTQNVINAALGNCVVSSNASEPVKNLNQTCVVLADDMTLGAADGDPMLTSCTSYCSNSALEEDDLYSNAKVLFRKKSQKQSQSQTSLSMCDQQSNGLCLDQPKSARNSLSPGDFLALIEAQDLQSHSLAPPPLPARNYSEEDINTQTEKAKCFSMNTNSDFNKCSIGNSNEGNGQGARPKTSSCRSSEVAEHSPASSLDAIITHHAGSSLPSELSSNSPDLPTDNIYEDIPDSFKRKPVHVDRESKEDELAYIDDDLSVDGECHTDKTNSSSLPEDVMIVSASDSCFGNDTDDSQATQQCEDDTTGAVFPVNLDSPETNSSSLLTKCSQETTTNPDFSKEMNTTATNPSCLLTKCSQETTTNPDFSKEMNTTETNPSSLLTKCSQETTTKSDFSKEMDSPETNSSSLLTKCSQETTTKPDFSKETDSKNERMSDVQNIPQTEANPQRESDAVSESGSLEVTKSPSESQQLSDVSSSTSSPASSSSSDTLNNLMDDADPDDFEGRDLSPPIGPSIHISHQQLLRHLHARVTDDVSTEPGVRSSSNRNARSMDLSPLHFAGHQDDTAPGASSVRRHSSSGPASDSHRDFLESMKQLKDCGWYWGPLSYEEAESKLMDKRDGSFLVRDSSNENYILSLSFKSMGQVHHTRIEHHKGLFSFWSQPDSHGKAQICQFIEQTVENSKNGRFLYFLRPAGPGSPPLPIQLLYPVSRFFRVPSLQHMCRFLVLRRVRRDHIDFLPIPQKVKGYLLEKQYYVETLDED